MRKASDACGTEMIVVEARWARCNGWILVGRFHGGEDRVAAVEYSILAMSNSGTWERSNLHVGILEGSRGKRNMLHLDGTYFCIGRVSFLSAQSCQSFSPSV